LTLRFWSSRSSPLAVSKAGAPGGKVIPMRGFFAFALFVCLAGSCRADDWLTVNHSGTESFRQGKWQDALAAFEKALPLATLPVEQAISASDMGAALHTLGRIPEAKPWFERAVAIWRTLPDHSTELAESAVCLADTLRAMGDFRGAENELRALLPLNVPNERKAALLNALADLLREQGRNSEARELFSATLALGELAPIRRIDANLGLADIDRQTGNRTAALREANLAATLARDASDASSEALALRAIGNTWREAGDTAKAEPILRRSLAMSRQTPVTSPRQIAAGLSCLASLYRDQGKYSLAEQHWLEAMQIEIKAVGPRHPQTAVIMESLSGIYTMQKRYAEAAKLAQTSWEIMSETFGEDSVAAAGALSTIAFVEQGEKRLDSAAEKYSEALAIFRAKGDPNDTNILDAMDRYASVLASLHRNNEARQLRHEMQAFKFR
jgi:tetratricopeptide (TPR) repeat protein